jgi:hypothetical protein
MLEMTMPHALFDVMTHLIFHLVEELDLCGPMHTEWMYCIEWMNKVLKGHVRNMACPEASMATRYIMDETLRLITKYMQQF